MLDGPSSTSANSDTQVPGRYQRSGASGSGSGDQEELLRYRQRCSACCCSSHSLCCSCGSFGCLRHLRCCRLFGATSNAAAASAKGAAASSSLSAAAALAMRHAPASLSDLCQRTSFSRQELRRLYRGFKNECPSGVVHRAAFREIFSQFFPLGDAAAFADLVFNSFDAERRGWLTFEVVVQGLAVISKGSTAEKLAWAFRLYDADRDGRISKQEMVQLVTSIYALMGSCVSPRLNPCDAQLHAERVFHAMDTGRTGGVSFQEFARACSRGRDLDRELGCFDTLL